MRRVLAILAILGLLVFPVRAEDRSCVALTFDDGPSGRFTLRLLEGLRSRGVKATFLLCGYRIKDYPSSAQAILDGGHEVGIHGYSHRDMGRMSYSDVALEISQTLALLPGQEICFFRPPGGVVTPAIEQAARDSGLAILHWSLDPKDWACDDAGTIVRRVVEQAKNGDVILLHDMTDSSVDAALEIVDCLLARGFCFLTASELAQANGIMPQPGREYHALGQ